MENVKVGENVKKNEKNESCRSVDYRENKIELRSRIKAQFSLLEEVIIRMRADFMALEEIEE